MHEFAHNLFAILRRLDAEARAPAGDTPTGLCYYGLHYEPHRARPRTEPCWSKRCAQLWEEYGYAAEAEVPYPGQKRMWCDNVITFPDGKTLWLELKGAWKTYWAECGKLRMYQSHLFHPLLPGLDKSKKHTAATDVSKLQLLHKPYADLVGLLLLGFDCESYSIAADVQQFQVLAKLDAAPWSLFSDSWPDPYRPEQREHAWLWIRPASASA